MAYTNPFKIANGLVLDFTLEAADADNDVFLGRNSNGEVTSFSSIGATRISGGADLTEATSSVLTINATGVLLGAATIQVKQASGAQDGYLSSTDWTTFNSKQGTALSTNRIWVGNGSSEATQVDTSSVGDLLADSTNGLTIKSGVIVNADVNANAAIALTKLATVTASRALVSDGSGFIIAHASTTATQVGYLSNLSQDVQTSLDALGITIVGISTNAIVQAPTASEDGYAIIWDEGNSEWTLGPVGAGGSVTGPGASTDNAIVRWNGADGTSIQNSGIIISDTGVVTGVTSITVGQGGIHIFDTGDDHDLILASGEDLTADHTLTLVLGDADRTVTLSGNPTMGDWFDQSVKAAASVVFADATLSNTGGLHLLDSDSSHDLIVRTTSNLTADRELIFVPGDATRTLTINASGTIYVTGGTDVAVADGGTGLSSIAALSLLVANVSNTFVALTPGAGESIRINAGGTAWEAYTPGGGSGIVIGSSTVSGGTNTRVLYNNSGVVGEYVISGTGNVAMTTSPTFVTPALGTPSALVGTNITGTATGLTSGITNALKSATTTVNVSSATAPSNGQILTATGSTAATWQDGPFWKITGTTTLTGAATIEGEFATVFSNDVATPFKVQVKTSTSRYVALKPGTTSSIEFSNTSGTGSLGIQSGGANFLWLDKGLQLAGALTFTNLKTDDTLAARIERISGSSGLGGLKIRSGSTNATFGSLPVMLNVTAGYAVGANSSTAEFITVDPSVDNTGAFTGNVFTGIKYNPGFTGTIATHYALLIGSGRVGIGTLTPTAKLHLAAGTTTASTAPLKFTTGTAMTTPEDGAMEYHSSHLYFTIGSTRYQLDQQGGGSGWAVTGSTSLTGDVTIDGAFNIHIGTDTGARTYQFGGGATLTATTKTLNLGTAGVSGSTTNINIGSSVSGALGTITLSQAAVLSKDATINGLTIGKGNNSVAANTAIGIGALAANTTGDLNTAIGYQALLLATDNTSNTAIGDLAMTAAVSGADHNTTLGYHAGSTITTGYFNTIIGSGNGSTGITTGSSNIIIGYQNSTGHGVTTGAGNIILGSGITGLSTSLANNFIVSTGIAGTIIIRDDGTNITFANKIIGPASTTSKASLNLPHGTAPSSPVDGDWWTTTTAAYVRINGVSVQLGSGGSSAISSLGVAAAGNTIDNTNYLQEWQWSTLGSSTGLRLSSTSTAAASNTQRLFSVLLSGANSTSTQLTSAAYFSNTHTGTSSTNVAVNAVASGGTLNWAYRSDGNVLFNASGVAYATPSFTSGTTVLLLNGSGDTSWNLFNSTGSVELIGRVSNSATFLGAYTNTSLTLQTANTARIVLNGTSGSNNFGQHVYSTATKGSAISTAIVDFDYQPGSFQDNAGSDDYTVMKINPIVNASGSWSGIVRGLDINPTLTALASGTYVGLRVKNGQIVITNAAVEPTAGPTDGIRLWAYDVSSSSELKVMDEANNITVLSPHNFDLIGDPSEELAWAYRSERIVGKKRKRINVDMLAVVREVEKIVGRQLVFQDEIAL